jgi:hypothetical protein
MDIQPKLVNNTLLFSLFSPWIDPPTPFPELQLWEFPGLELGEAKEIWGHLGFGMLLDSPEAWGPGFQVPGLFLV